MIASTVTVHFPGTLTGCFVSFQAHKITPSPDTPSWSISLLSCVCNQNKEQYGRELAWLTPKVAKAESRAAEIEGLVDQTNLRLFLLGSSHKKSSEEIQDLKVIRSSKFFFKDLEDEEAKSGLRDITSSACPRESNYFTPETPVARS